MRIADPQRSEPELFRAAAVHVVRNQFRLDLLAGLCEARNPTGLYYATIDKRNVLAFACDAHKHRYIRHRRANRARDTIGGALAVLKRYREVTIQAETDTAGVVVKESPGDATSRRVRLPPLCQSKGRHYRRLSPHCVPLSFSCVIKGSSPPVFFMKSPIAPAASQAKSPPVRDAPALDHCACTNSGVTTWPCSGY